MRGEMQQTGREQLLVEFIDRNKEALAENWMRIVRNHSMTRSYQFFDQKTVYERILRVFDQLGRWIGGEFTKGDIQSYYTAMGAKRRREGFHMAEVVRAMIVARRVLWFKIQEEGLLGSSMPLEMAMEMNNRVVVFFDRAIYYSTVGFERK